MLKRKTFYMTSLLASTIHYIYNTIMQSTFQYNKLFLSIKNAGYRKAKRNPNRGLSRVSKFKSLMSTMRETIQFPAD